MKSSIDTFPYKLVAPVVLIEFLFVLIPLVYGLFYSLYKVEYFDRGAFVGLKNYITILTSPEIIKSLGVTLVFTGFSLVITVGFGFILAVTLNADTKMNIVTRAVILIPYTISMLVGSLLIKWLISPDSGIFAILMAPFGLQSFSILTNPTTAMMALISNAVWRDTAFAMILLMAGLKSIPEQLYDAAKIDGADAMYRFRKVTLPLMRSAILISVIRLVIHFFNLLTIQLALTGGAPNDATKTLSLHLFKMGFEYYQFGLANALAILILLFNLIMIFVLVRAFPERVGV